MLTQDSAKTLNNGVTIPMLGYGSWQSPDDETTEQAVRHAINSGYRHIDCAAIYGNEKSMGRGIRSADISREELFITSKVWNDLHGYETTKDAFAQTLADLQLDYLDLYLIHWPRPRKFHDDYIEKNAETWRAMEELLSDGKVRAIGISNFLPHHIDELMQTAKVTPAINQVEYHPGFVQAELSAYCEKLGIAIEGYSPLAVGRVFQVPRLAEIAEKYGKNVAQLCIRWSIQSGVVTIPKSVTPARIADNFDVFDFEISTDDMAEIAAVECSGSGNDPDNIRF